MTRAVQPEPVASTTAPDAGADEARTARRAAPVADDHRDTAWAGRLRKPYVLRPAVVAVAVVVGLGMGALGDPATTASPTSQVATATRGPMTQTVSAEGTVAAA